MNVGLYRGMEAMAASERRLAALTSNLANAQTTGFKRVATFDHGDSASTRNTEHTVVRTGVALDWSQGALERTGVATDLSLRGEGFFAVEGPSGEVYTRDGQFHLNEEGVLLTGDGFPVAWRGARGAVDPLGEPIRVALDGSVLQGAQPVGQLKLVDFPAKDSLEQERHGYYVAGPNLEQTASTAEVHQFALEGSNVSTVDELVRLIETQRSFEAGSNVVQLIGKSYERLAQAGR